MQKFVVQLFFIKLPPHQDVSDWKLHTIFTSCLFKVNWVRYVELQSTHTFLFKTPRNLMKISNLNTQLGLGSNIVEWLWVATSLHYNFYWLTCRHEQTINYVTVQTAEPFPQLSSIPNDWRVWCLLNDKHTECLNSPIFPIILTQAKDHLFLSHPEKFIHFQCDFWINLPEWNLQRIRRDQVAKIWN